MARYINENDIYKLFEDSRGIIRLHVAQIDELPRADVVKVKHGYWEEYWENSYMMYFHRCSECKNDALAKQETYCDQILTNYCPHCGAKMDGRKEKNKYE